MPNHKAPVMNPSPLRTFTLPLRPLTLAVMLAAALPAQAQWANQEGLDAKVLHRFEKFSQDGNLQGVNPAMAPIAHKTDNGILLQGSTWTGRPAQDPAAFGMDAGGLSYLLTLDADGKPAAYQQAPIPAATGMVHSDLLDIGAGKVLASASHYVMTPTFAQINRLVVIQDGKTEILAPANTDFDGPLGGVGQHAIDDDGNTYYGTTSLSPTLVKRAADGTFSTIVDFLQYQSGKALLKGGYSTVLLWSKQDDHLYIASRMPVYEPNKTGDYPGVDTAATVYGALSRIPGRALRAGKVTADDIEVLHYFTEGNIANNTRENVNVMIEDGTWLYGGGAAGMWRFNRADIEGGVAFLPFSPDLSAVHTADAPNLAGGPAGAIQGPIALGLDGNIYGTSTQDASITAANSRGVIRANGQGALFRLVPGQAPDRSDDRIEAVRYFNDSEFGSGLFGVRAGPVVNGKHWLLGTTRTGGSLNPESDTSGLIYALEIDLPDIAFTEPLKADKSSYTTGERPVLTWTTTGAQKCLASGGWQGTQQASGRAQMPALATADTVIYSLTCEGLAGSQRSDASITVTQGDTPVQPVAPTEVQDVGGGATLPAGLAGLALLALLRRRPGRHACRT